MTRGRILATVYAVAALLPLAFFHRAALSPATRLVAALPSANPLDDPATNATAIARSWIRWEHGAAPFVDDRVFAPFPNALPCGESFPLSALLSYPVWAATGSVPAGVNAAYWFAVFAFPVLLYALYARLAGPGLIPAVAAFAVAYGPARMNTLGVLTGLSTGFAFLAVIGAWDFAKAGRSRDLALFAAALVAMGGFGLYPVAMGVFFAAPALLILAGRDALRPRRALPLAAAGALAFLALAVPYESLFALGDALGTAPTRTTFEGHAADVLSLLHGGIFGGPVRDVLEKVVPGFPLGAAAFFPTLAFTFAIGAWLACGRRDRSPLPWLVFALVFFVCALGPTVRLAGRPLLPGPYRLLIGLPILSSLRGIHRFDQWFDAALGAAAVLALASVRRHPRARLFHAAFAVLAILDLWPGRILATEWPAASPYVARLGALGADESVAVYPWSRATSTRAWVDQLRHGRRVVNGWFTYPPATHVWAENTLASLPPAGAVALLREMGASAVAVDRRELPQRVLADVDALVPGAGGITRREEAPPFTLFFLERRPPCLVSPGAPELVFHGAVAGAACRPDGLVFRTGPLVRTVAVRAPVGSARKALLRAPVAGPPPLVFTLSEVPPLGAEIVDAKTGTVIGRVAR